MEEQKKKPNLKISNTLIVVGILIIIVAIILIVSNVNSYKKDYDIWHNMWWEEHTADLNDKPDFPVFVILFSVFMFIGGGICLFTGLSPYITKLSLKHKKELLDYAGKDMTSVGTQIVDIGAPVVNKTVDDVIVPSVKKIKDTMIGEKKNTGSVGKATEAKVFCKYCGKSIDADSKFCSQCGKEQ